MRLYHCDLDWSIAYRLGLIIIRRVLKFCKEYKNGLQKWFMDMGTSTITIDCLS